MFITSLTGLLFESCGLVVRLTKTEIKSRALSVSHMHVNVISRSHTHTSISHVLALFWKVTLLFWPSEVHAYNRKISSFTLHRRSKCAWL